MNAEKRDRAIVISILLACSVLFALLAVYAHARQLGLEYLDEGNQVRRHNAVLEGKAGDPWQYRILADYAVEGVIVLFKKLGLPHPYAGGFLAFRALVSVLLFVLAALYYRKLGMSPYVVLVGLSLLGWGMTHSTYDSDLQFNTFLDVVFYLAAALTIMHGRYFWIIPITAVAALNRETCGLIPVMLLAVRFSRGEKYMVPRRVLTIAGTALLSYAAIFIALRLAFGEQPYILAYGNRPGIELFRYNVGRYVTWVQLFAAMGVLPLMALYSMRVWPDVLLRFFWAIVPVYVSVNLFMAILAEARVLLVPHTLVFVPGALMGLRRLTGSEHR